MKKSALPSWTKKYLIHPFSQKKGSKLDWVSKYDLWLVYMLKYVDNGCSWHIAERKENCLSPIAFQGENMAFRGGEKGKITSIGKIDKLLSHAIKNM